MRFKKVLSALLSTAVIAGSMLPFNVFASDVKDTLVVMDTESTLSLIPYATQGASGYVMAQLYDRLVKLDENGSPAPALAESWEDADDGKSILVHLRQGVTFTDGTDFNADAVIYCYEKLLEAPAMGGAFAAVVAGIEKVDDYTIKIQKLSPSSKCLELCATIFYIFSPTAFEADPEAFGENPVGCGAYVLDHWDQTTGDVYFNANENYYAGKPAIEKIKLVNPMDSATALVALETGELDFIPNLSGNDIALAKESGATVDDAYVGYSQNSLLFYGDPYASDVNLRHAISYAINKENVAVLAGENMVPATNFAPTKVSGDLAGAVALHEYNPEKAAECLAASGYAGETLELNILAANENEAVSIQADLAAIGITTQINILDGGSWYEKIMDGSIQMTITAAGGAYSTVEDCIAYYTTGGRYASLAKMAVSEELDSLLVSLRENWDEEARKADVIKALELSVEVSNAVPLIEAPVVRAYNSSLKGYNTFNGLDFSTCYFE